ncbi:hypothetical protein SAMN05216503_2427 [Polaribacter sp. KT25b]|uniref:hypothetical protein n=1 Tax=Polaribacter sp. KT25b TaxID=1855336 RepID=UPI00087A4FDE|nr:hypothetical protein [Polaribacter sp. KT25b]SDS24193.1 hypothetical protein SAMN05216503_2427 [Polaribacter sp. KT25b]
MKKIILGLFLIGLAIQSYSQEVLFQAKIKKEKVPIAVIESVGEEFGYLEEIEFFAVPIVFIEEDVYINSTINSDEDYETYQVVLKAKNTIITATYDKEGKLYSTVEVGKDIEPAIEVKDAMLSAFPGWVITKDRYKMTHYSGKQKKERYKFIIAKGKSEKVVYMNGTGEILKVHKKINLEL